MIELIFAGLFAVLIITIVAVVTVDRCSVCKYPVSYQGYKCKCSEITKAILAKRKEVDALIADLICKDRDELLEK